MQRLQPGLVPLIACWAAQLSCNVRRAAQIVKVADTMHRVGLAQGIFHCTPEATGVQRQPNLWSGDDNIILTYMDLVYFIAFRCGVNIPAGLLQPG